MIRGNYYVYCPCCGEEVVLRESDLDLDIDTFKVRCTNENCNNDFEITVEWKPIFHAAEIKYGVCLECSKDVEYTLDFTSKVNKYKYIDDQSYCLCKQCETKLKMEDVVHKEGFKFDLRKRK